MVSEGILKPRTQRQHSLYTVMLSEGILTAMLSEGIHGNALGRCSRLNTVMLGEGIPRDCAYYTDRTIHQILNPKP